MKHTIPNPHDRIETPDQAIDKVLTGLHATEVPIGLEHRILARVRAAEAMPSKCVSSPFRWLSSAARLRVAMVCAAVVVVLGSAFVAAGHRAAPSSAPATQTPEARTVLPPAAAPALETHVPTKQNAASMTRHRLTPAHAVLQPTHATPDILVSPVALPLTHQEQLLAQIARSGAPAQRAALNPEIRAQLEANDDAEFLRFVQASHETHNQ